jgi:hypothetical protein
VRLDGEGEIASALGATILGGRPVQRLSNVRSSERSFRSAPVTDGNHSFLISCEPEEIEAAYLAARSVVGQTGRWPVATAGWSGLPLADELDEGRIWPLGDLLPPLSDAELNAKVRSRWDELDAYRSDDHWSDLRHHLARTEGRTGRAPSEDEVRSALGDDPGELTLDRWLFHWEHAHAPRAVDDGAARRDQRDDWFVPVGQPCGVVLTPTANAWIAGGLLDFFGADERAETPFLLALLRRWNDRWGAEVVASFGTMLELIVERPPTEPSDVIELAVEHHAIAPCTLMLPGISVREYADGLRGGGSWFLHERP